MVDGFISQFGASGGFTQGVQGVQGFQGIQGLSGQGTQGIQGLSGQGTQGIQGITGIGSTGLYGGFYSNQVQPLLSTTQEQQITINNTYNSSGVSLVSNAITFANRGTYQLTFVVQLFSTSNDSEYAKFWIKYNGDNWASSTTEAFIQPQKSTGNPSSQIVTISFVGTAQINNDVVELYWSGTSTNLYLDSAPAETSPIAIPASPSVNVSVIQVAYAVQGTQGTIGTTGTGQGSWGYAFSSVQQTASAINTLQPVTWSASQTGGTFTFARATTTLTNDTFRCTSLNGVSCDWNVSSILYAYNTTASRQTITMVPYVNGVALTNYQATMSVEAGAYQPINISFAFNNTITQSFQIFWKVTDVGLVLKSEDFTTGYLNSSASLNISRIASSFQGSQGTQGRQGIQGYSVTTNYANFFASSFDNYWMSRTYFERVGISRGLSSGGIFQTGSTTIGGVPINIDYQCSGFYSLKNISASAVTFEAVMGNTNDSNLTYATATIFPYSYVSAIIQPNETIIVPFDFVFQPTLTYIGFWAKVSTPNVLQYVSPGFNVVFNSVNQSTQGIQGIQGIQGTQGIQGIQGVNNIQGSQGFQGLQGDRGYSGLSLQGTQGFTGFQGPQGIQGAPPPIQGSRGVQGTQGRQGTSLQGRQGTQGLQGFQGFGGQGTQGRQGTQGFSGQGTQGLQGIAGNTDPQIQGIQGFQGLQGIQGRQGTSVQGTTGIGGSGTLNPPFAGIFKTTSQVASASNTPQILIYDNGNDNGELNLANIATGQIGILESSAYKFVAILTLENTTATQQKSYLWASKNGTNITSTTSVISLEAGEIKEQVIEFIADLSVSDVIRFLWQVTNVGLISTIVTATADYPEGYANKIDVYGISYAIVGGSSVSVPFGQLVRQSTTAQSFNIYTTTRLLFNQNTFNSTDIIDNGGNNTILIKESGLYLFSAFTNLDIQSVFTDFNLILSQGNSNTIENTQYSLSYSTTQPQSLSKQSISGQLVLSVSANTYWSVSMYVGSSVSNSTTYNPYQFFNVQKLS